MQVAWYNGHDVYLAAAAACADPTKMREIGAELLVDCRGEREGDRSPRTIYFPTNLQTNRRARFNHICYQLSEFLDAPNGEGSVVFFCKKGQVSFFLLLPSGHGDFGPSPPPQTCSMRIPPTPHSPLPELKQRISPVSVCSGTNVLDD